MKKTCLYCNKEFSKPYFESKKNWLLRHKYCSRRCYVESMKGKLPISIKEWNKKGIAWNKGKQMPQLRGDKNPNWKGGTYGTERHAAMGRIEYILWRTSVFTRDEYICQMCSKKGGNLEADHIKPWSLFPELRYAIDNGRTLCTECHKQTETWGKKILTYKFSAQEA